MKNKLYSVRERIILFFLLLTSIASLLFFFQFKTLAFPEYNIQFSTNRTESAEKAKKFLSEMGIKQDGYQDVTVFTIDDEAKTYLERTKDVNNTAALAEDTVDLWHFTTRVFKPLEKEEYSVSFLPSGRFSGFSRVVSEDKKGASLSQTDALILAEEFRYEKTRVIGSEWELVDINTISRKHRTDYYFVWKKSNFTLGEATYRQEVGIIGDEIGSYAEYVQVPESWQRQYENERSQNDLAQMVAEVVSFVLFGISAIIFFILQYRNNKLRLRFGSYVAVVTFVIVTLASLNSLPLVIFSYDTTQSWGAFIGQIVLESLVAGGMLGFINFFIVVVGESLYRQFRPQHIAIEQLFKKGLWTHPVNKSLLIGSFAGIISFGYVVLYYILGRSVGFWSPAEINYNDIFSTYIPWIYPLFIGFTAAVFEESVFRLFGIPFLIRFVKRPWIAVVITAFVWGFLHSNYPQSPWYARGIEVGLEGLLLGFLFLRFGILTSIVSHYTFNALITSVALSTSANSSNTIISFVIALLPLIVGVCFLLYALRNKSFFTQVTPLTNEYLETLMQKTKQHTKAAAHRIAVAYRSLTTKRFVWITILLAIISTAVIIVMAPSIAVGEQTQVITRSQALERAEHALREGKILTNGYMAVSQYTSTPPDMVEQEYLQEYTDFETVQKIYPEKIPTAFWTLRYFKPLQKEEFIVYLLPDGKLYSIDYVLSEEKGGGNLSKEEARKRAEDYLRNVQHKDLTSLELVSSEVERRKNRTDYHFSFEEVDMQIKDATVRVDVSILGKEPSGFQEYLQLPEKWLREKQKTTEYDFLFTVILLIPVFSLLIYGIVTFFWLVKKKQLQFKQAVLFSIPLVIVSFLQLINQLPIFLGSYLTSIPLETYLIETVLGMTVAQIVSFFFVSVVIAMSIALWRRIIGPVLPFTTRERWQYIKDALFIGYLFPFLLAGYGVVIASIAFTYNLIPAFIFPEELAGLDTFFPAFTGIDTVATALLVLLILIIILLLIYKKVNSPIRVAGVILAFLLLSEVKELISPATDIPVLLFQLALTIISFGFIFFIVVYVIRTNILAYFMIFFTMLIFTNAWDLLSQEQLFYQINGYFLLAVGLFPLVLYFWKKRQKQ